MKSLRIVGQLGQQKCVNAMNAIFECFRIVMDLSMRWSFTTNIKIIMSYPK